MRREKRDLAKRRVKIKERTTEETRLKGNHKKRRRENMDLEAIELKQMINYRSRKEVSQLERRKEHWNVRKGKRERRGNVGKVEVATRKVVERQMKMVERSAEAKVARRIVEEKEINDSAERKLRRRLRKNGCI
jgi:hypothetical protein